MSTRIADWTPRRAAAIAGVGYVIIFFLAIFANFFVRNGLLEAGDASATAANIVDSEGLFRAGMVAFLVVFIVDVIIAWGLYVYFKTVNTDLSLLAAWFRVVYTVFLGVALIFFFIVLQLVGGADYLTAFDVGQLDAHVLVFFDAFNYTWLIGLVAFGFHLVVIGYLIYRSGVTSKILSIVLMVAGTAYVVDTVAHMVLSNYADLETVFLVIVAVPSVIGEAWFGLWLLLRAGKEQPALA